MKRHHLLLGLALVSLPLAAWADVGKLVNAAATVVAFVYGGPWAAFAVQAAQSIYGSVDARRQARRAAAKARAEYNASLQDRSASVLQATPPQRVVYGRCVVGGDIVAIFTSDKTGTREDGTSYTKPDALKHLVIAIAAHEVQAINDVLIEGVSVGALDGSGYPTGGEFLTSRTDSRSTTFTTSITVSEVLASVINAYSTSGGTPADYVYTPQTVTISAPSTLNGPVGVPVTCNYTVSNGLASVRIQKHLGTAGQAADAYLQSVVPSQWTVADQLQGIAYCVVTLDLEDTRFQGGPPNITFDVSGKLLYDTRTGTTAWSNNPALCVRDFLTSAYGYEVDAADVDDASVSTAANACDALISLTVGGVTTPSQATYTCNGSFSTADAREGVLEDLVECMAGYAVYGAQWRVLAGTWTAPVMALTDDDLDGQIEVVQAGAGLDELFNGVRGTYIASGKATPTDFDTYQNATFKAADGRDLWTDITLPYTDNRARARNLARIFTERARSSQMIRYPAKLRAWPLQIGDRVTVTSTEYGWAAKTYRVTDWQFGLQGQVVLTLQEDVAGTYDLADAASADPSPNTGLPDPWVVAAISGFTSASGTSQLIKLADGTIRARIYASWTAVSDSYIADGSGRIEFLWRRPGDTTWRQQNLPGDTTSAWIDDVREGELVTMEVRAVNGLGVRGPSAYRSETVIGKSAAPSSVAGLSVTGIPGGVQVTWTPNSDADYLETEVRYGASWAAGTQIFRGAAAGFVWPWPPAGSYTVRVKHRDTSRNESAEATAGITVGNSSLIDTAQTNANLATEIYTASYTGAGGGNTPASACEVAVSVPAGARVLVTGNFTFTASNSSGSTQPIWASFGLDHQTFAGSQGTTEGLQSIRRNLANTEPCVQSVVCTYEYSGLAAGTWYFSANATNHTGNGTTNNYTPVTIKVEVIKR